jgi:hypothetical protein
MTNKKWKMENENEKCVVLFSLPLAIKIIGEKNEPH